MNFMYVTSTSWASQVTPYISLRCRQVVMLMLLLVLPLMPKLMPTLTLMLLGLGDCTSEADVVRW